MEGSDVALHTALSVSDVGGNELRLQRSAGPRPRSGLVQVQSVGWEPWGEPLRARRPRLVAVSWDCMKPEAKWPSQWNLALHLTPECPPDSNAQLLGAARSGAGSRSSVVN